MSSTYTFTEIDRMVARETREMSEGERNDPHRDPSYLATIFAEMESGVNEVTDAYVVIDTSDDEPWDEWSYCPYKVVFHPRFRGNNTHRHETNPMEKEFHDLFVKKYVSGDFPYKRSVDGIVLGVDGRGRPPRYLTDEEVAIAISAVQWMASPVGQGFLAELGFNYQPE